MEPTHIVKKGESVCEILRDYNKLCNRKNIKTVAKNNGLQIKERRGKINVLIHPGRQLSLRDLNIIGVLPQKEEKQSQAKKEVFQTKKNNGFSIEQFFKNIYKLSARFNLPPIKLVKDKKPQGQQIKAFHEALKDSFFFD
ncbi:hypothetical protein OAR19_00715, partial [bacterium]|nr:hypothetical protein [bacterium]